MVKLFVEYITMDTDMACKIVAEGEDLKEALFDLMDRTSLYTNRERIEEEEEDEEREFSADDVLEMIKDTNYDGGDYIVFIKDGSGKVYLNEYDIEEW